MIKHSFPSDYVILIFNFHWKILLGKLNTKVFDIKSKIVILTARLKIQLTYKGTNEGVLLYNKMN